MGAHLDHDAYASAQSALGEATTLPADAYTDETVYDREVERLFRGQWLCAGRVDQVPAPGDYLSLDLLGEHLVVTHGLEGEIRVLSRICRHRAAEIVSGSGNGRSFQCPYHLWTYGLDGALVGAPHMDDVPAFDPARCALPQIRSEIWEGWVFVNLDGAADPLGEALAPMSEMFAEYEMGALVAEETAVFDSPFNWKVLVDNFMEAYHHIATHRDTLEPIFPGALSHVPDNAGPYSVLVMPPKAEDHGDPPLPERSIPGLSPEQQPGIVAAVVYPFHLFAPAGDTVAWYQLLPEAVDRFTLRIYLLMPKALRDASSDPETRAPMHGLLRTIHEQDIGACEAVMAGLRTSDFDRGPLARLEKAIWEFNQWWCERMLRD